MKSIVIFASGQGTNTKAIINHFKPYPQIKIGLIVCNRPNAGVIPLSESHDIPVLLINKSELKSSKVLNKLLDAPPDLIVLAGFLLKIPGNIIQAFPNKIINLHPALLPKYGGKGMYGKHVHEAVKAAGETESGMTIHRVNTDYDKGSILLQARCPVYPDDRPEDIANRIHTLEHFYLPRALEFLLLE